ncbi:hypothetical protein Ancab_011416 [Ancistrocladus abbreviatus]
MCSGSKREDSPSGVVMDAGKPQNKDGIVGVMLKFPILLELSADDDLTGFKQAVEDEGHDVDETGFWYGRRIGCKKMGFEERTPLMIAAMFGSKDVLNYILKTGRCDVNRACGADVVTALHCAAASGSVCSHEVVELLIKASADISCVDAYGNQPGDVIAPCLNSSAKLMKKALQGMLKGVFDVEEERAKSDQQVDQAEEGKQEDVLAPQVPNDGNVTEKKEYPIDPSLPDIKNGIYGTDEFRMYTFKVKPCSRAYSHDWTECPFVHPGENARRRDPRKYHYSCVPCPEFRKGSCTKGDSCEYAHGIFECWLHPAQYRTRLCKDETNCSRRVCFFAHKPEELRPLYASTGSAVPSPRSYSSSTASFDISSISPLAFGSPSLLMSSASTPPLTPTSVASPIAAALWPNQLNITPPSLQLPSSRLKTGLSARDMDIEAELVGLENQRRRQQLLEELAALSSPSSWNSSFASASAFTSSADKAGELNRLAGLKPTKLDDIYGSLDPARLPQLEGLSLDAAAAQMQSPTGMQIRQNINHQLLSSYSSGIPSSPVRASVLSPSAMRASPFGINPPASPTAGAASNSRSAAFANRSQSFIDRSVVNRLSGLSSPAASGLAMPSHLSDWASPDGKLDWGIQGEELNKLRKSASFGIRTNSSGMKAPASMHPAVNEPDVSWVQSIVKDAPTGKPTPLSFEEQQKQYHTNNRGSEVIPPWVEQLYKEQEQMVA